MNSRHFSHYDHLFLKEDLARKCGGSRKEDAVLPVNQHYPCDFNHQLVRLVEEEAELDPRDYHFITLANLLTP